MKVYSDTLTTSDLRAALPDDVGADIEPIRHPRTRRNGWTVYLEGLGARHNRRRNSGHYGANGYGYSASWDDHGVWMAALYDLDPDARIAHYKSRDDFYDQTSRYLPRGMSAPWLKVTA